MFGFNMFFIVMLRENKEIVFRYHGKGETQKDGTVKTLAIIVIKMRTINFS